MRSSVGRFLLGPLAALFVLTPLAASAGPTANACNLLTSGSCSFVTTPATCEGQCTPPSFIAECDGQCTASADVSCTGTCNGSCMTMCNVDPGSFNCTAECTADCQGSCSASCNGQGAGCASDCMGDCSNRCGIQCSATPPTATCTAQCQASCNASCEVQANLDCHVNCTAQVAPGQCDVDCKAATGAVFCGSPPQYVDLAAATSDCITYLESEGIKVSAGCTVGSGCVAMASSKCSVGPAVGAVDDGWGAFGVTGLVVCLGLAAGRRRRLA